MVDGESTTGGEAGGGFSFDFGGGSDSGSSDGNPDTGSGDAFGAIEPGNPGSGVRDATGTEFDPARHIAIDKFNRDGSFKRKRGRKSGQSNSAGTSQRKNASGKASVDAIRNALEGVHLTLAFAFKAPEIALEDDESKPLSEAVAEVAKHYDIPDIAPVTVAWISLMVTAGRVYGPKAILIRERIRAEKARKVNGDVNNVVDLHAHFDGNGFSPIGA